MKTTTKNNERRIFWVALTSIEDGCPLGGGPSRRGEYLAREDADSHVNRLVKRGCEAVVKSDIQRGNTYSDGSIRFSPLMPAKD